MNFQEKRRSKNKYPLQCSDDQYSYQDCSRSQRQDANWNCKLAELQQARDRLIAFIQDIGKATTKQIREDILTHCQNNSKKESPFELFMNDEMILRLVNIRIQKMIKNKRIKKNWSDEDVQILIWIISKYCDRKHYKDVQADLDQEDWTAIAMLIPGVNAQSCMFKWLSLKKINLATNNWSQEESNLLARLVKDSNIKKYKKDSKDWKLISQNLYFMSTRNDKIFRNAKQCRQHWNCYLNPNLKKGPWNPEEDIQLLICIRDHKGSKKWSDIVRYFDGRTQNALKNRYTLIIQKQKRLFKHKSQLEIIDEYLEKSYVNQFTQEIKDYCSLGHDLPSQNSFNSLELPPIFPWKKDCKNEQNDKIQGDQCKFEILSPVKVQKINLQNLLAMDKLNFKYIQPGMLTNGVFQKAQHEVEMTDIGTPNCKLKLKKYHSSLL